MSQHLSDTALKLSGVTKTFDSQLVVAGVDLRVGASEIFALLGPNGAGKSTIINMIAGVSRLGGGSIEVFGFDNQRQYLQTRQLTGVMHQEIVFDNFFSLERILQIHPGYFGVAEDAEWREHLLERLALIPHRKKKMRELSGGMRRRLMLAKALIHKPKLLILDEPTAGVDIELRMSLWDFVREINKQGTTILLTTHYLEEAEQMCDRIAIMNHGKLVAVETKDRLLAQIEERSFVICMAKAVEVLPAALIALGASIESDRQRIHVVLGSETALGEVLEELRKIGGSVQDIFRERTSLEDVFLRLTSSSVQSN